MAVACVTMQAAAQEDAPPPPPDDSLTALSVPRRPWRNLASVVVGVTLQNEIEDGSGFTLGVEYERRLHKWYGVGALAEWTFGGPRDFVVGPAFTLHPTGPIRVALAVAGGLEGSSWSILYRMEFCYEFNVLENWVVAPSFAVDFGQGRRILFFGASLGRILGTLAPKKP